MVDKQALQQNLQSLNEQILARGRERLQQAMDSPDVQEVIRKRVCEIANSIIFANPEWKKIRKNEHGDSIEHRFTDSTNWEITIDKENITFYCNNITPPSRSIFNSAHFGYETKYEYDRNKDPYDGSILSVWIDQGLWIDATRLFEEVARANGSGKINVDNQSMRRAAIPFFDETYEQIIKDAQIKQAIINAANKIK